MKKKEKKTTSLLKKKNGKRIYYGAKSGKLSPRRQHIYPALKEEKEFAIYGHEMVFGLSMVI